MKKLYYFPIIHNPVDTGSASDFLTVAAVAKYGEAEWKAHLNAVENSWKELNEFVTNAFDGSKTTRVYQDSMVFTGEVALEHLREQMFAGSWNHRVVLGLILRGAILESVDDREALEREIGLIKNIKNAPTPKEAEEARRKYLMNSTWILEARDETIARGIQAKIGRAHV
jgi:hypothetical protein